MDVKEEEILGDRIGNHWYYRCKAAAMLRSLGSVAGTTALDIGSGSGFFAARLLAASSITTVDCVDQAYDADSIETVEGGTLRRRRDLAGAVGGADVALLMDVLEHVEDDVGLLRETVDHVRPGGRVLITVPAFQWLWSGHDDFLGHLRRYDLAGAEHLVSDAGLAVERGHYGFGLVLPLAAAQRVGDRILRRDAPGSKLSEHHPLVNWALHRLTMAEMPLQHRNRLAGLSVFVVGRRR